jgi:uncharacterized membrane protein
MHTATSYPTESYLAAHPEHPALRVNVSEAERTASLLGGGLLAGFGLSRMSLGCLALAALGGAFMYRGLTGHCHVYGALGLNTAEPHGPATAIPAGHGIKIEKAVTINRSPEELYRFWRNLENLPRFMHYIRAIKAQGNRSHWVVQAPMGSKVEWDAEIINERPNELIAWKSVPGSEVDNTGSVHFHPAPSGAGTEVKVTLKYDPPAGQIGATFAKLLGDDPEKQIQEALRELKQMMEAGEVPTATGKPPSRW